MLRVMLVDDYAETLETLSIQYKLHTDVDVVAMARNGKEMWDALKHQEIDFISLDIQLGGEDGINLCTEVRKSFPNVFIAICSVEATEENRARAEAAGASYFLAKPIGMREVREALVAQKSWLSSRQTAALNEHEISDLLNLLS